MSDPVSSMDVEDVLSSIRRLVSEEAKGTATEQQQSTGDPSGPIDIHTAAEQAVDAAVTDIVRTVASSFPQEATGTPPSNAAETGDEDGQMSFRHQAAAAQRRGEEQKLVLTAALRVANPVDPRGTPAPDASNRPQRPHLRPVEPTADFGPAAEVPSGEGAGVTDGDAAPDANPDNTPDDAPAPRVRPFDFAPEDTLFDRAKQAMSDVASEGMDEVAQESDQDPDTPLGAAFAPAPEDGDADTKSASALRFNAKSGAIKYDPAPFADTVLPEDEPSTINFAEEEESILDEETLRDMVSEMVREELQGELGDRITRNVRKLVRREIQRAIASREFE